MDSRNKIYWGEFNSSAGVLWRVELWKRADGAVVEAEEIKVFGADALVIEWSEVDKLTPVEPSSATLTIISPSDRKFIDLYQVETGAILLNVYKDDYLYWSGSLDTELYEEPYAYNNGYEVVLTFSDFSVLSRTTFNPASSLMTLENIVNQCIALSEIEYNLILKQISTKFDLQTVDLTEFKVNTENFLTEDNEYMSAKEVLEGILQPFALKIRQKNGKLYIYDLNALYQLEESPSTVEWSSTDSNLLVDKVVNDFTLTFSPYANAELIKASLSPSDMTSTASKIYNVNTEDNINGFRFHTADCGSVAMIPSGGAKYFYIEPANSGSSEAGIVYSALNWSNLPAATKCGPSGELTKIITSHSRYIQSSTSSVATADYRLRIQLDTLFDVRYNPFESASLTNEEGHWDKLVNWANIGYIGVCISVTAASGQVYYYNNKNVFDSESYNIDGYWTTSQTNKFKECYLCYYNLDDRRGSTGFGGWQKNKKMIGFYQGDLPSTYQYNGDGMQITFPPIDGELKIEVSNYIPQFDFNREIQDIYPMIKWVMFKDLKVDIVRKDGFEYDSEDLEIKAWLNLDASEGKSVSTIVGQLPQPVPNARGLLLSSQKIPIVANFTRAEISDKLERLLIGTAYSNYATRHNILKGEIKIEPEALLLADQDSAGKFWVSGEEQRVAEDEGSITLIELQQEHYSGICYE